MNKFKILKIIFVIIQIICVIFITSNNIYASSKLYEIYNPIDNPFKGTVSMVIGIIQAIGMSVAVIMLTIIGIKYIIASPEGKADLKQQLPPYLIGCVLLFAGSGLIGIIANVANEKIR